MRSRSSCLQQAFSLWLLLMIVLHSRPVAFVLRRTRGEVQPPRCGRIAACSSRDCLTAALEPCYPDGTRKAVLLIGAGLHHHLKARSPNSDGKRWDSFTDWNGLLASVADHFNLSRTVHEDPAATWESLISRVVGATGETGNGDDDDSIEMLQAHKAEKLALRSLASALGKIPADVEALNWLGTLLVRHRDVICLNFDRVLERAAHTVNASVSRLKSTQKKGQETLVYTFNWTWTTHLDGIECVQHGRVWNPHGEIKSPASMILGTTSYAKALNSVTKAWRRGKACERTYQDTGEELDPLHGLGTDYWAARRDVEPYEPFDFSGKVLKLSWVDMFLESDLIIVGTSLDRAELDLWWALSQRQRNLARKPVERRPKTIFVCARNVPERLKTAPAGIEPVQFESWGEAWEFLSEH